MALFWIVQEIEGERRVFIQEAGSLIFARLRAAIAGLGGKFVEAHVLDDKRAQRVPKNNDRACVVRSRSLCAARPYRMIRNTRASDRDDRVAVAEETHDEAAS